MSDFMDAVAKWKTEKPEVVIKPKPPKIEVELSDEQKRIIINYMLGGVSKGIFEDCEEFWKGLN